MGRVCAWWTSLAVVWMLGWVVGARTAGSRRVRGTNFDAEVGGPAVISDYDWPVPTGTYNLWEYGSMSAVLKAVPYGRPYMVCVGAAATGGRVQMEVKVEGLVVFDGLVVNEEHVNVYCGEGPSLDNNDRAVSVSVSFKNASRDPPMDRNLLVAYTETVRIRKVLFAGEFKNKTGSSGELGGKQRTWIFHANGDISNFVAVGKSASRVCIEMKGTTGTKVWPVVTISSFPAWDAKKARHFMGSVFWTNWRNICVDMRGFQGTRRIFRISFSNEGESRALYVRRLFVLGQVARLAATPEPHLPASCSWSPYFKNDILKPPRVASYTVSRHSGSIFYIKEVGKPTAEDRRRSAIFKISRLKDGSLGEPRRISPASFSLSADYSGFVLYDPAIVEEIGRNDAKLYLRMRKRDSGLSRYESTDEWVLFDVRARAFVKLAEYKRFGLVYYAAKENTDGDLFVAWGKESMFLSPKEYFSIDKISPNGRATLFTSEAIFSSMDVASDGSLAVVIDFKKVFMIPRASQVNNIELKKYEIAQAPLPSSGVDSTSVRVFADEKIVVLTVLLADGIQIWTTPWNGGDWKNLGKSEYISVRRREGEEINDGTLFWIPSSTVLRRSILYTAYVSSIVFERKWDWLYLSKTYVLGYNLSSSTDRNWYDLEFSDSPSDGLDEASPSPPDGPSIFSIDDQVFIRHPDANADIYLLSC